MIPRNVDETSPIGDRLLIRTCEWGTVIQVGRTRFNFNRFGQRTGVACLLALDCLHRESARSADRSSGLSLVEGLQGNRSDAKQTPQRHDG